MKNPADAPAVIALFEAYVLLGVDHDTASEKVLNVMRGNLQAPKADVRPRRRFMTRGKPARM